MVKAVNE
jgi:hypothetical protein